MNKRILVVDDLPLNRRLLQAVLESEGYEVLEARDGVDALEKLEREQVSAIVSDILMPHMDGYRLCREVRNDPRYRDLPFLFFTSTYTSREDEQLALNCGGDRFLRKPAPASVILATMREILHAQPQENRATVAVPSEHAVMRHYNAALIRKLEDKNSDLVKARDRLARLNEELEIRIEERTAELRAANEELDAFSQSIAHDLRSPLAGIGLLATLLEEGPSLDDASWKEYLNDIQATVRRMNTLIDDLLALAQASRGELNRQSVDASALASEVVDAAMTRVPDRMIEFHIAPSLRAEADPGLLRIVFENLIGNAIKYTGRQTAPVVEVGGFQVGTEEIYYVKDNGAGFDAAQAARLFQPFARLHTQEEFPGTGIGLTTVRRVITRHGGRIWAEAVKNAGATFFFTLRPPSASGG